MIWLKRLILLSYLIPCLAVAETVTVTSGEHAGFSRLTFQLPAGVTWEFGRSEEDYVFQHRSGAVAFDITRIFERIPTTRILGVVQRTNAIVIDVAENTHADVFELRDGRIAIDIKDGGPSPYALFENPILLEVPIESATAGETESVDAASSEPSPPTTPVEPKTTEFPIVFPEATATTTARNEDVASPLLQLPAPDLGASQRTSELEELLLKQIGRAVSQGLLDAELPQRDEAIEFADPAPAAPVPMASTEEETLPPQDRTHVQIQSSVDREKRLPNKPMAVDSYGEICFEDKIVALPDWGNELADGIELGDFRAAALEEFDIPQSDGVRDLVRYYLFLSFGAEARLALNNFGMVLPNHDVLLAMSDIMDYGHSTRPSRLTGQFRCDGDIAFWSLAAMEKFEKDLGYNLEAVLATFSEQPLHIRRLLGPSIAERFLQIGDDRGAKLIQNAIARAEGVHGDAFELLDAELSFDRGEIAQATETLTTLVEENGPLATEALLRLLNAHVSRGADIDPRHIENAEALLVEHRGTPSESQLFQSIVGSWNVNGMPKKAFAHLNAIPQSVELSDTQNVTLWSETAHSLARLDLDVDFAATALRYAKVLQAHPLNEDAKMAIAKRLLALGFTREALDLARPADLAMDTSESQQFFAEANLLLGKPEVTLEILDGTNSTRAQDLRARALFALNNANSAFEALHAGDMSGARAAYALLSERWGALEKAENKNLSQIAELAQSSPNTDFSLNEDPPSLEAANELLSLAQKTRDSLTTLLD